MPKFGREGGTAATTESPQLRERKGPSTTLVAAGYFWALVFPTFGVIISFIVARDQSRAGQRHATRIFVLAIFAFVAQFLILRSIR